MLDSKSPVFNHVSAFGIKATASSGTYESNRLGVIGETNKSQERSHRDGQNIRLSNLLEKKPLQENENNRAGNKSALQKLHNYDLSSIVSKVTVFSQL